MKTDNYIISKITNSTISGHKVLFFKNSDFKIILPILNAIEGDTIEITKIECIVNPIIKITHNNTIIKYKSRLGCCRRCKLKHDCVKKLELDSKPLTRNRKKKN